MLEFTDWYRRSITGGCYIARPDPKLLLGLVGDISTFAYVGGRPLTSTDPLGLLEDFTFNLKDGKLTWENCECKNSTFSAFSGIGRYKNKPDSANVKDGGAIPQKRYYIVSPYIKSRDPRNKYFNTTFFKLFADDEKLDDQTFVDGILRDELRFHPGIASLGCVTLTNMSDWTRIQYTLLNKTKIELIPGTKIPYYGTVTVR